MESFSFIHAADLHLDTPFAGIGRIDPKLQKTLQDASLTAFDNLVSAVPVVRNGTTIAVVHGISFRVRTENRNLSSLFPPRSGGDRPFHIGLLHCNVGSQSGHGDYAPCTLDDLCSRAIDYWALGHI